MFQKMNASKSSPCRSHCPNGDPLNAPAVSPIQDRLLHDESRSTIPSPCRSHCPNGDPLNADAPSPVKHRLLQNQSTTTAASPCRSHCRNGDLQPHQSNLRKGRYSEQFGLYSVTKCCAHGFQLTPEQKESTLHAILNTRERGHILLHAFVIMTDHLHLLITLKGRRSLSNVMREVTRYASISATEIPIQWQKSFYDHKVRDYETVTELVSYIENNPCRKNLATLPNDWQWSSANSRWAAFLDRVFLGHNRWRQRR